jgi:hypothetical protein
MVKKSKRNRTRKRRNNGGPSRDQPKALQISAPVSSGVVRTSTRPRVVNARNGDIRVVHREYIADVAGSIAFAATQYSVNPALPGTFPWLTGLAQRFESYRFNSLKFCFETQASTTATGTILLAPDYDAADPTPTTKTQSMSYRSSVRSPAWSSCCLSAMSEDLNKRKSYYVRTGALATNLDIKLYDVANLFVCTQGQAGATAIGELYVEYDITLMTPQLGDASVGSSIYGTFTQTAATNVAPFAVGSGNLPATVVSTGTTTSVNTWTFTQPWQGIAAFTVVGTTITNITDTGTATSTELGELINGGATAALHYVSITAAAGQTYILTIPNASITASTGYFAQGDF